MALTSGTRLGRYEILASIGAGGMGEVYLAQDLGELRRKVALKFLPPELASDVERMQRFIQEARTASSLNHPNLLTIYEFGEWESVYFIATEYIEGETLRQSMARSGLDLRQALDIVIQVAYALVAAHKAGIVHRDIKPENIMVREDRIVKVLDFGLAKPVPRSSGEAPTLADEMAPRGRPVNTNPNVIMGTVAYMSPEQARGRKVDERTDIWSLGVVLYEIVAGRLPFLGETQSDVLAMILQKEPTPLERYSPGLPTELERIIRKALQKDPDERYQTVKDLAIDLRNLRRGLEFEAELERSVPPSLGTTGAVGESSDMRAATGSAKAPAARTGMVEAASPTSSAEYIISEIKRHKKGAVVVAGLFALIVLISSAFITFRLLRLEAPVKTPASPSQAMKIVRLTSTVKANQAAISPDGKYLVHVTSEDGKQSLRMRQVNITSGDQEIVPSSEVRYTGLTFSRDGEFIYYVASEKNGPLTALYQVPVLGGTSRKIASDVGSAVTFSPDGRRIAFIREFIGKGEQVLMVANADGSGERQIAARKFPNFFKSVSWSPDGKTFACGAGSYVPTYNSYVVEVPVDGGPERSLSTQTWLSMGQVEWLQDGSGIILNASEPNSTSFDTSQIWHLSYSDGSVRRVTNDLNNYSGVSLTFDSSRLVAVQSETTSSIWLAPRGDAGKASQITSGVKNQDGREGIVWTPDDRIAYVSKEGGGDDIWIMRPDGGGKKQLTAGSGINNNPDVCPNGRFIVFTSTRTGAPHIWRMDLDGANPKQLTSGSGENHARCSPDGRWVAYTLFAGKPTLWRVPIDGGAPSMLTDKTTSSPAISPDGQIIAAIYWDESQNSPARIAIVPSEGGDIMKAFEAPKSNWGNIRWSADGRALTFVVTSGAVSNIWSQPIAGGSPKQLTDFKMYRMFWFDWSRDGGQLVCSRGAEANDVVLISNFR